MGSIHTSVRRVPRAIVEDHETYHEIGHEFGHGTSTPNARDQCTARGDAPSTGAQHDA
ncbi:hypothetical protein GCM10017771_61970 [Streptomyces capitiformicae]|uniref:Uncharacterized protein n=1 Tax=Streptomyces capitiformicae TaxID=2014920 RepID=A0A919DF97_9ACTN|nr:hypothetical protein GCM10017771_61970 [Streptomyces capitiformicae]